MASLALHAPRDTLDGMERPSRPARYDEPELHLVEDVVVPDLTVLWAR